MGSRFILLKLSVIKRETFKMNPVYKESWLFIGLICSTMWLGCQSRRFNCLFWRETRQRILGHEISPYPEVGRGRERGSWRGTRTRAVDDATQQRGSWRLDSREASSRGLAWNHGQGQSTPDTGAERRGSMG